VRRRFIGRQVRRLQVRRGTWTVMGHALDQLSVAKDAGGSTLPSSRDPQSSLVMGGLALLLSGCAALGGANQMRASPNSECSRNIAVLEHSALPARPTRTLRRVSTTCASKKECMSTLSARACELGADAAIVDSWRVVNEPRYEPAGTGFGGTPDPKRLQRGEAPQTVAVGPPRLHAAEGRLVIWVSD